MNRRQRRKREKRFARNYTIIYGLSRLFPDGLWRSGQGLTYEEAHRAMLEDPGQPTHLVYFSHVPNLVEEWLPE